MNRLSKEAKRHFRELAGLAYERELSKAWDELLSEFNHWKEEEIDAFELSEKIHRHHDGVSRELYKLYVYGKPTYAVARALAEGILEPSEVGEQYLPLLGGLIGFYREEQQ
jgi:hypothetical protein